MFTIHTYILTITLKLSSVFSQNGSPSVHAMLSGHVSFFPACMCALSHAPTAVNESVHLSMFH